MERREDAGTRLDVMQWSCRRPVDAPSNIVPTSGGRNSGMRFGNARAVPEWYGAPHAEGTELA